MANRAQYLSYIRGAAKDGVYAFGPRRADRAEDKPELQEPTTKERSWDGMHNYNSLPDEKKQGEKLHNLTNKNKVKPIYEKE